MSAITVVYVARTRGSKPDRNVARVVFLSKHLKLQMRLYKRQQYKHNKRNVLQDGKFKQLEK